MARYIDVDLLEIETQSLDDVGQGEMQFYSVEQIDNAPTVDAITREKLDEMIAEIEEIDVTNLGKMSLITKIIGIIYECCGKENKDE